MAKDYYSTLGVGKNATQDEIKRAYKEAAKKSHPDLHKGDKAKEEKFKEINEAYKVLGDEKSRSNYDRFGSAEPGFQGGAGGFNSSDFGGGFEDFDIGDIFEGFFGGGGRGGARHRGPKKGADLVFDMEITLEDAYFGAEKQVSIMRQEKCVDCKGTGAEDPNDITTCPNCKGTGTETSVKRTPFGLFQTSSTCSRCNGTGKVTKNPCKTCKGTGKAQKKRTMDLTIPKGIDDGTTLRIAGEGNAGENNMPSGDLYVRIHIHEHDIFERDGADLHAKIKISFIQAILGDEIEVPTIDGRAKMKIPQGTQTGTIFRLKGKGMPSRYAQGDELIMTEIVVPSKLSKKQKEILENYAKNSPDEIGEKGFFSKLRDALK